MNDNRWLFIGTDKRISACSENMAARGYECNYFYGDSYTEELKEMIKKFSPKHLVFPILQLKNTLPLELLEEGMHVYVGVTSKEWLTPFEESGVHVHHYLQDEQFIWRNARLTAEGFITEYHLQYKAD